jgi:Trk-type K+ transport system membrane component
MPNKLREKINLAIYDSKRSVLGTLRIFSFLVSVTAILTLIYYYGFPNTSETNKNLLLIIKSSFAFYVLRYYTRFFYSFKPLDFIKENWFESILMNLLLIDGIGDVFFGVTLEQKLFEQLGLYSFTHFYFLFIQLYILIIVGLEIGKGTALLPRLKLNPALMFILSFVIIIGIGTGLLMLPEMTTIPGTISFIDALFTSTSASCVTGLIVVDTATYFTPKGHFIIMALIKLGGLNIIAFAGFFALASKFGIGIKHHSVIEDFISRDSLFSSKGLLGQIIIWSFIIEICGALLMYFSWSDMVQFNSIPEKIFSSVFHSFSAFNNAGFTLFTGGLFNESIRYNYMIQVIITILVFFGALGFVAIFDLFSFRQLKARRKHPWRDFQFSTKIALYFSFWLVVAGAVAFYILEYDNSISDHGLLGSWITAVFQSVTRTSGFNTVDIGSLTMSMTILILVLMFMGGASSSAAGGIKTSTMAVIYASVIATIRGKKQPELYKHSISNSIMTKALAVLIFFITFNLIGIFLLSISESHILAMENRTIMDLIFEEVSALGTVGLSMGITPHLSAIGKSIVILSMLIGRVGTLTIAFSFGNKVISSDYKYPEGHTLVG